MQKNRSLNMNAFLAIAILAFINGCNNKATAPQCQLDSAYQTTRTGNAGCFVKSHGKLLVVRQRLSLKLTLPGGSFKNGETAQCTAHRETWEESGFNVKVEQRIHVFDNGFQLFKCTPTEIKQKNTTNDKLEVSEVLRIDPRTTNNSEWRYSNQHSLIVRLFEANSVTYWTQNIVNAFP